MGLASCQSPSHKAIENDTRAPSATLQNECYANHKIPSMGAFFELQLVTSCENSQTSSLVLNIKDKLDKLESELSLYQKNSALSTLNELGEVNSMSSDFLQILTLSKEHHLKTHGVFNVAIYPLLEEIKKSSQGNKQPKISNGLKKLLDLKNVVIQGSKVHFKMEGMKLTFDGIAKGYAVDEISNILEQAGINKYLINFSGNMRWKGQREDGQNWKIAIWDPVTQLTIPIQDRLQGAIASSGIDYNYYSKNKKWHHIIDPRTLVSAQENIAATIIGPTATVCDILSTSAFILNQKEREMIFKEHYAEYGYWVRTKNKQIFSFQIH